MRSSAVRLTLTLLAVGAMAAAAYLIWAAEHRASQARQASAEFESVRSTAVRETLELRAAQQTYVAAGQNETFWIAKTASSVDALRASLSSLTSSAAAEVSGPLERAEQALQDFQQVDRRARSYAATGQRLLASDIIFSDGLETTARVVAALDEAGEARARHLAGAVADARRDQLMAGAGASVVVLIALILLTPRPRDEPAMSMPVREAVAAPADAGGLELGPVAANAPAPADSRVDTTHTAPSVELERLASVCTDLARLSDTSALAAVLERAAGALDASGLVLWVVDPDGNELIPVAAYGYPASVLSRMGNLKTDAENATAAAFRTGLVQTVKADAISPGAIAAPLVTPAGSRGVMSAEVRHNGEKQSARLAAASIVAAQLATLVGPPAARSQDRTGTAAL